MAAVSTPLYLCVDCGGTKTSVVICNSAAEVVGRALGGPSNFSYLGLHPFVKVLTSTVEEALSQTPSFDPSDVSLTSKFASVWVAVSGVDSPSDIRILSSALSQIFAIQQENRLRITNDAHLLASPLQIRPEFKSAVAVIAGTGSVVISFAKEESISEGSVSVQVKEMARAGGWGWMLGDEGSGFEVGREAVREILMQADIESVNGLGDERKPVTHGTLKSRILSYFGVRDVPDIFSVVYAPDLPQATASSDPSPGTTDKPTEPTSPAQEILLMPKERRLSRLSFLVFQSAFEDNDELALAVLRRCAGNLARQIAMLLVPTSDPIVKKPKAIEAATSILCLGGSLAGVAKYRDFILDELKSLGHVFGAVEFVDDGDVAAAGARGLALIDNTPPL